MKTPRKKVAPKPLTTVQRLDGIIKSARKIMRKDKGLNGDLDRLPMLTWIMFLKFLDDMERIEQERAELAGRDYRPLIEPPYRWRDWAAGADGISGPDLLAFLTAEQATRPDGTSSPGLFGYLQGLRGDNGQGARRDVIATVFQRLTNRMESGYLLRDVINLVDGIHFDSSDEIHTLGRLYETLLREMRDAAGDSGEFYTPRPVVRFMVAVTDPQLGETVLDPACGTGGFLTEAFRHLERRADTVEQRKVLQEDSIYGGESKSLPFLLAQMNLLLHGLHAPRIDPGNSLRFRLTEIGEEQRVNVILTNPPFGGEEEAGILNNFPDDRRTTETALLFLQLIMRRLKRGGRGRAAVVVPNGTLFGDGLSARIKADLLERFRLHTIVRLPEGVFAPYTDIPTNLIFFDTNGPTETIWYYEQPRPEGRRKYSKTAPLLYEELADCLAWWKDRQENERAWKVDAKGLVQRDEQNRVISCNLDIKNPHSGETVDHRSPAEIVDSIIEKERRILAIMDELKVMIESVRFKLSDVSERPFGEFIELWEDRVPIQPTERYPQVGVRGFAGGLFFKDAIQGSETKYKTFNRLSEGLFVVSQPKGWEGAVAVCDASHEGWYVSPEYRTFRCKPELLDARYLAALLPTPWFQRELTKLTRGQGARRERLRPEMLLNMKIRIPALEGQRAALPSFGKLRDLRATRTDVEEDVDALLPAMLDRVFKKRKLYMSD